MQAVEIKLGSAMLTKEQKIMEQQTQINQLTQSLNTLKDKYHPQLELQKENQRHMFEYKNIVNLLKIENEQAHHQIKQYEKASNFDKEQISKLTSVNSELQQKVITLLSLQENSGSQNNTLQCATSKLTYELDQNEKRNIQLEKIIASQQEQSQESIRSIQILEKTVSQKDKHIALLLKEKDRMFNKENETTKQYEKRQLPKNNDVPLKNELKDEKEILKLKKQNMDLIFRLKNKQQ